MDKNQIYSTEKQIKDKLNQLESSPRPIVWDKIEFALNNQNNYSLILPFWANAASVIGGLGIGLFLMLANPNQSIVLSENIDANLSLNQVNSKNIAISPSSENSSLAPTTNSTIKENESIQITNSNSNQDNLNANPASKINHTANSSAKNNIPLNPFTSKNQLDKKTNKQNSNQIIPREETQITIQRNNETIALEVIGNSKVPYSTAEIGDINKENVSPIIDFNEQKAKIQREVKKGFYVGINGGPNTSLIFYSANSTNPIFNQKSIINPGLGITYGLTFGYDFNNRIGLQTGFNYTRFNSDFTQPMNDYTFIGSMSIFQFDIPLIFKYKFNYYLGKKQNPFTIAALFGLQYSQLHHYYLQAKLQSNSLSNQFAKIEQDDRSYNQNQLSYLLGMEFKYFIRKNWSVHLSSCAIVSSDISQFPIFVNNSREKPIQLGVNGQLGVQYHFLPKKKKATK